jgi:quercetin dioxygenase-like cupin family protein
MSTEITRELLQTTPLADLPGWEVRLFLISYPPGADANNHSHPVVGVGFVLEGVIVSAFDNDPEETFVAGQSFVDRASHHRIVRNGSDTEPDADDCTTTSVRCLQHWRFSVRACRRRDGSSLGWR